MLLVIRNEFVVQRMGLIDIVVRNAVKYDSQAEIEVANANRTDLRIRRTPDIEGFYGLDLAEQIASVVRASLNIGFVGTLGECEKYGMNEHCCLRFPMGYLLVSATNRFESIEDPINALLHCLVKP